MPMKMPRPAGRRLADGAVRGFVAEALILPTGLVTAAVLTRVLGPEDYGRFSLVSSLVVWLTLSTVALLGRATVKFVSDAEDWRPVASTILRARLIIGALGAALLLLGADQMERLFGVSDIAPLLRVFALDVLLINLVRAHRETLTGIGRYRTVALISAARWLSRMVLIVALVVWMRSVMAAVIASVLTSAVELAIASRLLPMPWRALGGPSTRHLAGVAGPLLVFGLTFQLHTRIDLFALTALQRTSSDVAQAAGWYGAAQNLAVVPGLFMMTVAPLVLATLGRLQRDGHQEHAKRLARDVLRFTIALLPTVAIAFACASELVSMIFGQAFGGAAPLVGLLFAAGEALGVVAVMVSVLIAANRQMPVLWLGLLLITGSVVGHLLAIPRYGAIGAASVTLVSSTLTALVGLAMVRVAWDIRVMSTLARAGVVAAAVYGVGAQVTTMTAWGLAIKLVLLTLMAGVGLLLTGEVSAADRVRLVALLRREERRA